MRSHPIFSHFDHPSFTHPQHYLKIVNFIKILKNVIFLRDVFFHFFLFLLKICNMEQAPISSKILAVLCQKNFTWEYMNKPIHLTFLTGSRKCCKGHVTSTVNAKFGTPKEEITIYGVQILPSIMAWIHGNKISHIKKEGPGGLAVNESENSWLSL